jgi:hypothetical protein
MSEVFEETKRLLYSIGKDQRNDLPSFEEWLAAKEGDPKFRQCLTEIEAEFRQKRREARRRPRDA